MKVPANGSPKPTVLAKSLMLKSRTVVSGVTTVCSLKFFGCWNTKKIYLGQSSISTYPGGDLTVTVNEHYR